VEAINTISGVINQINDIFSTIATQWKSRTQPRRDVAQRYRSRARQQRDHQHIGGDAEAAQSTTRGSYRHAESVQQLVETSDQLRRLVELFKINRSGNGGEPSGLESRTEHAAGAGH